MNDVTISKFISLVLRHNPSLIKLDLDANGWVSVDQLIANAKKLQNVVFTKDDLFRVVDTNDKKPTRNQVDGLKYHMKIHKVKDHSLINVFVSLVSIY